MDISILVGKRLKKVSVSSDKTEILFETKAGERYMLYHDQDCCETVTVYDIIGDLKDLLDFPITMAEEITSCVNAKDIMIKSQYSFTWTFYNLATVIGYVTIRWYGESNGYYSEKVDFKKL